MLCKLLTVDNIYVYLFECTYGEHIGTRLVRSCFAWPQKMKRRKQLMADYQQQRHQVTRSKRTVATERQRVDMMRYPCTLTSRRHR